MLLLAYPLFLTVLYYPKVGFCPQTYLTQLGPLQPVWVVPVPLVGIKRLGKLVEPRGGAWQVELYEEELPVGLFSLWLDSSPEEVGTSKDSTGGLVVRRKSCPTGAGLGITGGMQLDVPMDHRGCPIAVVNPWMDM